MVADSSACTSAYADLFANNPPSDEGSDEGGTPPVIVFDHQFLPNITENIWNAQQAGYPNILHYNGGSPFSDPNRDDAMADHDQGGVRIKAPLSRDEYPFASTREGGDGAWVGIVPLQENRLQGLYLGRFYQLNQLGIGDPFGVVTTNYP
jgi:hypothetical protein